MDAQITLDRSVIADENPQGFEYDDGTHEVTPDLSYKRLAIVNCVFFGVPLTGDRRWVLIDTGILGATGFLKSAAEKRFGEGSRPSAIVLTHGHFDHVGGLRNLAEEWEVPVYAHTLETPYLNGEQSYPPADPPVGGGLMARLSPLYPRGPVDVSPWLRALPEDGSVPGMPGWQWLHTPGHTPGHVSFWRESDRTLLSGDAFITTRQESAYAVATQAPELHGPPKYFTPDWDSARNSVQLLASLEPELIITGHGFAMSGELMRTALHHLARDFDTLARPGSLKPG